MIEAIVINIKIKIKSSYIEWTVWSNYLLIHFVDYDLLNYVNDVNNFGSFDFSKNYSYNAWFLFDKINYMLYFYLSQFFIYSYTSNFLE